jgi:hypothetical protein
MRRSPKAIETMQQVDFIVQYANYIHWKLQQSPQQMAYEVSSNKNASFQTNNNNTVNTVTNEMNDLNIIGHKICSSFIG